MESADAPTLRDRMDSCIGQASKTIQTSWTALDKHRLVKSVGAYLICVLIVLAQFERLTVTIAGLPVACIFIGLQTKTWGSMIEAFVTVSIIAPVLGKTFLSNVQKVVHTYKHQSSHKQNEACNTINTMVQVTLDVIASFSKLEPSDITTVKLVILIWVTFIMSYLRSRYPRFGWASTTIMLILVNNIQLTVTVTTRDVGSLFRPLLNTVLAGSIVIIVNGLFKTPSAHIALTQSLTSSCNALRIMLRTEVLALIDPSDANRKRLELAEKDLFKTLATIKTTSSEACLEMTYGYMQPKEIAKCGMGIIRLARHVGGISVGLRKVSHNVRISQTVKDRVLDLAGRCEVVLESIKATIVDPAKFHLKAEDSKGFHEMELQEWLHGTKPITEVDKNIIQSTSNDSQPPTKKHRRNHSTGIPLAELAVANEALKSIISTGRESVRSKAAVDADSVGQTRTQNGCDVKVETGMEVQFLLVGLWAFATDVKRLALLVREIQEKSGTKQRIWFPVFKALEDKWTQDDTFEAQSVVEVARDSVQESSRFQSIVCDNFYALQQFLRSEDAIYGLKAVLLVFLTSFPATMSRTSSMFQSWSMHWTTYFALLCLDTSIGSTVKIISYRSMGALLGALWGWLSWWSILPGSVWHAVVIFIWLVPFATAMWWIIIGTPYRLTAMMALVTYGSVIFPMYLSTETPSHNTMPVVRATEAVIGSILAIAINIIISPLLARTEIRKNAAEICNQLSIFTEKLSTRFFGDQVSHFACRLPRPGSQSSNVFNFTKMGKSSLFMEVDEDQLRLELFYSQVQNRVQAALDLVPTAVLEPNLERPYDCQAYENILDRLQTLLNLYYALGDVLLHAEHNSALSKIAQTENRPEEMIACIVLFLHITADTLFRKSPFPAFSPPARAAWSRWVATLPSDNSEASICLNAWAISCGRIVDELEVLKEEVELVFGRDEALFD